MDLDNIHLPDFVLADLYKNCLVLEDNVKENAKPLKEIKAKVEEKPALPPDASIKFLGRNNKNIAVVVNDPKALFINEAELDFLTKILLACNLNLADIAIVNLNKQDLDYTTLKEQLNSQTYLLLGIDPSAIKLPFTIPHFQVQHYAGNTFVCTPALSSLLPNTLESKLLKSKLWLSLKSAFNL